MGENPDLLFIVHKSHKKHKNYQKLTGLVNNYCVSRYQQTLLISYSFVPKKTRNLEWMNGWKHCDNILRGQEVQPSELKRDVSGEMGNCVELFCHLSQQSQADDLK